MNQFSFGGHPSPHDLLRIRSDMLSIPDPYTPEDGIVKLDYDFVNELSDQHQTSTCTACGDRIPIENYFKDGVRLSEFWFYLMGKLNVDKNLDEGSSILTMLSTAYKLGVPSKEIEKMYPLETTGNYKQFIDSFNKYGKIPQEVLDDALNHKIPGYYQVNLSPLSIAHEINNGKVLACRFVVGDNTYKDKNGKVSHMAKDLLPLRVPKQVEGGHIMAMNKYSDLWDNPKFAGPNSWGERWCPDNMEDGKGYYNFFFNTLYPSYFTEVFAIADKKLEPKYIYTRDLTIGSKGEDVAFLQKYLVGKGFLVMPIGVAYGYFGTLTQKALASFQKINNITPSVGYFGPITRAKVMGG